MCTSNKRYSQLSKAQQVALYKEQMAWPVNKGSSITFEVWHAAALQGELARERYENSAEIQEMLEHAGYTNNHKLGLKIMRKYNISYEQADKWFTKGVREQERDDWEALTESRMGA